MALTQTNTEIKLEAINRARQILNGEVRKGSKELKELYQELEAKDQFAYASEVLLAKMRLDEGLQNQISQKEYETLAKYIYKDHSLPSSFKFDRALKILETHCKLLHTDHCETLGLAGAIYKRKWQFDHQFKNLELSLHYYKQGFQSWKKYLGLPNREGYGHCNDSGYTAINYAYINELIAVDKLEEVGKKVNNFADLEPLLDEAQKARTFILNQFDLKAEDSDPKPPSTNYWVLVTLAEAYFGLFNYTAALKFIKLSINEKKKDEDVAEDAKSLSWKLRSFSQQLSSIGYLQFFQKKWTENINYNEASRKNLSVRVENINLEKIDYCLSILADPLSDKPQTRTRELKSEGKLGLALSGGGFRAALYHIGVLAALAEQDQLKDIEVISCVSGGSILGAFYYLKLKKLLEAEKDGEVDYITIIKELEKEFLEGVQKNLRMRIFSNLGCNLKMLFDNRYSRTHRLGELYEDHLYKRIFDKKGEPIYMSDLIINPKDDPDFSIVTDNWKRKNKIPQLILNSTSVNTGHNWQFTASWMGEPPGNIQPDIDVKPRLRRMYYKDAPPLYKKFRLGHAVGASSCVPVMFEPMPLYDLYEDENAERIELQLIDGGLHDNQGIAALIEQECKNMIISDASGQMSTTIAGTGNEVTLFYRADTILQERLRELQFQDIKERNNTTQINTLSTFHLKSDLQRMPVSWVNCTDPPRQLYDVDGVEKSDYTKYEILREVQTFLSEIRTDLDSFNDIEAYALMYSGYAQTNYKLKESGKVINKTKQVEWQFSKIEPYLKSKKESLEIKNILSTAKNVPLKIIHVSTTAKIIAISLGVLLLFLLGYFSNLYWNKTLLDLKVHNVFLIVSVFVVALVSNFAASLLNYKAYLRKKLILVFIVIFGFIVCNFYLIFLNPLYNKAGKVDKKKNR